MMHLDNRHFGPELSHVAQRQLTAAQTALAKLSDGSCLGGEWTGWYNGPQRHGLALVKEIGHFCSRLDVHYDAVVVIGIGGSYLGCRAVAEALTHPYAGYLKGAQSTRAPLVLYAGQHFSESALDELLDVLDERQPLLNVISKSGATTESAVAFRVLRSYMEKRFGPAEAARRIIATTDQNSGALRAMATAAGYQSFVVPADTCGRYSVLTAVGLVPLALAGFDIAALVRGADGEFQALKANPAGHSALLYAASRKAAYESGKKIDLLAYTEPRLAGVAEWWKHLFGESEGKEHTGLFPAAAGFTTELHSLGQYLQEGPREFIETFLTIDKAPLSASAQASLVERRLKVPAAQDQADGLAYIEGRTLHELNQVAMEATILAHSDSGVPSLHLRLAELDEANLGSLFAFFEVAAAVSAQLLGVNAFNQPGVEAYKKNMFALLGKPGFETYGAELRRRV